MVSFTTLHRWNSLLCPPLGFIFNFFLLWLILRRTPKEMRVHSRILLQTCATDCLLLMFQCVGQQVFTMDRKDFYMFVLCEGYFVRQFKRLQTPLFLFHFHFTWAFLHYLGVFGIVNQFFYRYLVLNRNIKISLSQYLLFLFGTALCIFAVTILTILGTLGSLNRQPIDRERFGTFVDFDKQLFYFTMEVEDHLTLVALVGYVILATLTYATTCICGSKMVRFVRKNTTLTGKLKELNRQLTKCLIILACVPLFIAFATLAIIYDILFGRTTFQLGSADWTLELELYLALSMHLLPVLNPLTTIYVNRPYRDALIGRFVKIASTTNG